MMPELLLPVGSPDSLIAAVRSGADAVYMGYGNYNARRSAQNFDDDGFKKAVEYCHISGVKVYLTLNTLVSDGEISGALKTAKNACTAGADGFIVQDIGLARLLKSACPDMPLHASTQMTVTSPSALYELKELGFVRVVLAREMNRREIAELCETAHLLGMETEVFVHGALCMCVSGQCYMSAVIGRRSGNRGQCAQPCRLPCEGGYPLSLKDLSLISYVKDLTDIGVDSFKIEGRMKRPEYIAASASAFRQMLDTGCADKGLLENLSNVFTRSGHTDGYYKGALGNDMFGHRTETDVAASERVLSSLRQLYRGERQSVAVKMKFYAKLGEKTRLTVTDGEHSVTVLGDEPQIAARRAVDYDYIKGQCEKLGGTAYYCADFECDIDENIALSASALNAMRRECAEKLNDARKPKSIEFKNTCLKIEKPTRYDKTAFFARFSDIDRVPDDLSGLEKLFVPVNSGADKLADLINRAADTEIGVELPRALFSLEKSCEKWLAAAKELGVKYALCHNIAAVNVAKKCGMKIVGGFGLNVFNSAAVLTAKDMGAEYVTLSFELSSGKMSAIAGDNLGVVGYGKLPLMLTRNCPVSGNKGKCGGCSHNRVVVDRMGERFNVDCNYGMSELVNSKVLWLADRRDIIDGYRFIMLNFTDEDKTKAGYVISAYLGGDKPHGEFTRGLYDRGVL